MRERLAKRMPREPFRNLSLSDFRLMSRWFFLAVREMVKLENFRPDPSWIAARLLPRVSTAQVEKALAVLQHLRLLKRGEDGNLQLASPRFETGHDVPNIDVRLFHKGMLDLAAKALKNVDVSKRYISGSTLTITAADLPRAKDILNRYQREIAALLEAKRGDEVYQLNVQFFPLTDVGG